MSRKNRSESVVTESAVPVVTESAVPESAVPVVRLTLDTQSARVSGGAVYRIEGRKGLVYFPTSLFAAEPPASIDLPVPGGLGTPKVPTAKLTPEERKARAEALKAERAKLSPAERAKLAAEKAAETAKKMAERAAKLAAAVPVAE